MNLKAMLCLLSALLFTAGHFALAHAQPLPQGYRPSGIATPAAPPGYALDARENQGGNAPADANESAAPRTRKIHSGTGFFVSNRGHIITNEHVVRGCKEVMIRGAVEQRTARVIATDAENDLALLDSGLNPPRIAVIRDTFEPLEPGDPVSVIGYPGQHGITGELVVAKASVIAMVGPQNEKKWIQFSSSAQQGNSGGPLLDSGGNVVGVIVGKAKIMEKDSFSQQDKVVKETDIAISLPQLRQFLDSQKLYYKTNKSTGFSSNNSVVGAAVAFIVNIHCQR